MRILIVGGTGYLGTYFTNYLKERHDLRLFVRSVPDYLKSHLSKHDVHIGELTNPDTLKGLFDNVDAMIHLASPPSFHCVNVKTALDSNVTGLMNLLDVAQNSHIKKIVYFSTFHVYRPGLYDIHENSPTDNHHPYAWSHITAEQMIKYYSQKNNWQYGIIRSANGYGIPLFKESQGWGLVINKLCKEAIDNHTVTLTTDGTEYRNFIHNSEQAKMAEILINSNHNGVFNLGGEETISLRNLAQIIIDKHYNLNGEKVELNALPITEHKKPDPFYYNIERAKKIGFTPNDSIEGHVEKMIKEMIKEKINTV